jgi:hypothetical protein
VSRLGLAFLNPAGVVRGYDLTFITLAAPKYPQRRDLQVLRPVSVDLRTSRQPKNRAWGTENGPVAIAEIREILGSTSMMIERCL